MKKFHNEYEKLSFCLTHVSLYNVYRMKSMIETDMEEKRRGYESISNSSQDFRNGYGR